MALDRPGIFLFGPSRSGKSSIAKVVFAKLPPHETLFLPSTTGRVKLYTIATNPYMQFSLWDFPGDFDWSRTPSVQVGSSLGFGSLPPSYLTSSTLSGGVTTLSGRLDVDAFDDPQDDVDGGVGVQLQLTEGDALSTCSSIIFVLSACEEQLSVQVVECIRVMAAALAAMARFRSASTGAALPGSSSSNPYALPHVDVFMHQTDGDAFASAGTDAQGEVLRDIATQFKSELADLGFVTGGGVTGAGGGIPLSIAFHATSIYDHSVFEALSKSVQRVTPGPTLMPAVENLCNALAHAISAEKVFLFDVVNKLYFGCDSSPSDEALYTLCADMMDVVTDVSCIYDPVAMGEVAGPTLHAGGGEGGIGHALAAAAATPPPAAHDAGRCSHACVRLANGNSLYMREVAPYLACVCVLKAQPGDDVGGEGSGSADTPTASETPYTLPRAPLSMPSRALVDYNISVFARALAGAFAIKFSAHAASAMSAGAAVSLAASYKGGMHTASVGAGLPLASSLTSAGAIYSRSYGGSSGMMARTPASTIMGGEQR